MRFQCTFQCSYLLQKWLYTLAPNPRAVVVPISQNDAAVFLTDWWHFITTKRKRKQKKKIISVSPKHLTDGLKCADLHFRNAFIHHSLSRSCCHAKEPKPSAGPQINAQEQFRSRGKASAKLFAQLEHE